MEYGTHILCFSDFGLLSVLIKVRKIQMTDIRLAVDMNMIRI